MNKKKFLTFIIFVFIFNISCSKDINPEKSIIEEKSLDLQIIEAYQEGLKELEAGDVLYAAKKFNEVENLFPKSEWAAKSNLMAAYAYYTQQYYFDTIEELKLFLKKYPMHQDIDYAYYLMGVAYYEQIVDEKKDLYSIKMAKEKFEKVINDYPNTDYALDAKFKLDLIADILASKEMYLGRYYFQKKKWIPSINRFNTVVNDFDTTIYVDEALHRLVEIYYTIGLIDEAKKYANLLGYNYKSSKWYEMTYSVFDKKYKKNQQLLDKKNNIIVEKIKSLID